MKTVRRQQRSPRKKSGRVFFRGFLRSPLKVGTFVPSSRFLENRVTALSDLANSRVVVELGAGTGGLTRQLLAGMPGRGNLLSIEIDPGFCEVLQRIHDDRLLVYSGSACELQAALSEHGLPAPDTIVSGIPFSTLPRNEAKRVIQQIWGALAPGGRFVAYQISARVEQLAEPWFGTPHCEVEYRNLPPLRVFCWQKPF
jgi:phospholipid N-methyltransferase